MNEFLKNLGLIALAVSITCPLAHAQENMSTKTRFAMTGFLAGLTVVSLWKRDAIQRKMQSFIAGETEENLGTKIDELKKECLVIKGTMSNYDKSYNDASVVSPKSVLSIMNIRNCDTEKLLKEVQNNSKDQAIHGDPVPVSVFKAALSSLSKTQDATLVSKKQTLSYLKIARLTSYAIPAFGAASTFALWKITKQ